MNAHGEFQLPHHVTMFQDLPVPSNRMATLNPLYQILGGQKSVRVVSRAKTHTPTAKRHKLQLNVKK